MGRANTNALYSPPTVDNAVMQMFGMQPGMDRLNLLPRHDPKLGWIAPNLLYQMARAAVSPGVAARGGYVSPEDAVNFAGNISADALIASAAMRNPAPGPGKTLPMTVYHGSPHNFDAFDISKIGTGEGAQAYGHGLYVAENPNVAKSYITAGGATPRRYLHGVELTPGTPEYHAATLMDTSGKSLASVRKEVQSWIADAATWDAKRMADRGSQESLAGWKKTLETLNTATKKSDFSKGYGALYHVDLPDEHIANMLDWDKPLSQQPANVQAAFKRRITEPKAIDGMDMGGNARLRDNRNRQADPSQVQPWVLETQSANGTSRFGLSQKDVDRLIGGQDVSQLTGAQIYQRLAAEHGGFPQASEMMKNLGIPGIKYLDGGSRAAGNGTRNYVVFDDKLLKILKKE